MNDWIVKHKYALITLITLIFAAAVITMVSLQKDRPLEVAEAPLASTPQTPFHNFIEFIFHAENPQVNHARYKVPGSLIISLDEVTEFEVKPKKMIEMKEGRGAGGATVTTIPDGVTMTREAFYDNNWARVTYGGKTGYIRTDEASVYTIPVVWSEDMKWAKLERGNNWKKGGVSAIENALTQLLKPYEWGAEGPDDYDNDGDKREGFDCSGLTQWAYHQEGIEIPRTTATGYDQGIQIQREDIEIGDLIYFNPPSSFSPVSHVGMYMGDDMMLHATGAFMEVGISGVYWERMVSIVRFE